MDEVPATLGESSGIHHLDVQKQKTIVERLARLQIDMEKLVCETEKLMYVFRKMKEEGSSAVDVKVL